MRGVDRGRCADEAQRGSPTPSLELRRLAEEMLAVAIATRSTEALLLCRQATLLAWLSDGDRFEACGFASLYDLAREILGLQPRTVRERLSLHRIFAAHASMESAFLEGRLTACQVLAAAPFLEETSDPSDAAAPVREPFDWASAIAPLSVREIRYQARKLQHARRQVRPGGEHPDEAEGRTISFTAPIAFQAAFDPAIELARKVLGWDAPVYACIEAMLQETHWLGVPPLPDEPPEEPRCRPIRTYPRVMVPHRGEAISHARETMELALSYVEDVRELIASGEPGSPGDALLALKQIHLLRAPQRVIFARLIRDLRRTYAMDLLGCRSMAELVEDRLGLSERSARDRVAESLLFETDEGIARAYAAGEISIMQARLIRKLGSSVSRRPFMGRAREVSWRQFQREYRLLELMKKCGLESVARRPLPDARIEEALIGALGGDREAIETELREHGIPPLSPDGSADPVENPLLMERLEMLVHLLVLRQWDDPPRTGDADRQMSAAARLETTVRFWAPKHIADDLLAVLEEVGHRETPWFPKWAVMTLLFEEVSRIWEREDPERTPGQRRIMMRDHYRCMVPGCTRRARLEAHHIVPRSQGGTNDAENLIALCHEHHRLVHAGHVRITGRAPDRLRFELGLQPNGPPLLIYNGERIVKGAFDR
jgi:hypothetical protein